MKKSIQLIALVAVALLSSCGGGEKDKATAEKVDEKPRVKLARLHFLFPTFVSDK